MIEGFEGMEMSEMNDDNRESRRDKQEARRHVVRAGRQRQMARRFMADAIPGSHISNRYVIHS